MYTADSVQHALQRKTVLAVSQGRLLRLKTAKQPTPFGFDIGVFKSNRSVAPNSTPALLKPRHDVAMEITIDTLLRAYHSIDRKRLCRRPRLWRSSGSRG